MIGCVACGHFCSLLIIIDLFLFCPSKLVSSCSMNHLLLLCCPIDAAGSLFFRIVVVDSSLGLLTTADYFLGFMRSIHWTGDVNSGSRFCSGAPDHRRLLFRFQAQSIRWTGHVNSGSRFFSGAPDHRRLLFRFQAEHSMDWPCARRWAAATTPAVRGQRITKEQYTSTHRPAFFTLDCARCTTDSYTNSREKCRFLQLKNTVIPNYESRTNSVIYVTNKWKIKSDFRYIQGKIQCKY